MKVTSTQPTARKAGLSNRYINNNAVASNIPRIGVAQLDPAAAISTDISARITR